MCACLALVIFAMRLGTSGQRKDSRPPTQGHVISGEFPPSSDFQSDHAWALGNVIVLDAWKLLIHSCSRISTASLLFSLLQGTQFTHWWKPNRLITTIVWPCLDSFDELGNQQSVLVNGWQSSVLTACFEIPKNMTGLLYLWCHHVTILLLWEGAQKAFWDMQEYDKIWSNNKYVHYIILQLAGEVTCASQ